MRTMHALVTAMSGLILAACADGAAPTAPSSRLAPSAAVRSEEPGNGERLAVGLYSVTVPADVFGIVVNAHFAFAAHAHDGASAGGGFTYDEQDGSSPANRYTGSVTCFNVYDFDGLTGNRAKIGGVVETSTDPTVPPGTFMWWQSIDEEGNGPGKTTLAGVGDAAANEAFCNSSNPPRFGPFRIRGFVEVRAGGE